MSDAEAARAEADAAEGGGWAEVKAASAAANSCEERVGLCRRDREMYCEVCVCLTGERRVGEVDVGRLQSLSERPVR